MSPGAARAARIAAAALIPPLLCLAAILVVKGAALLGLRKLDPAATFESISIAGGTVRLEGVRLPGRGFEAPEIWIFLDRIPNWTRPERIVIPSCTLTDPSLARRGGGDGRAGGPSSVPDIRMDAATLVTGRDTSLASGWIAGDGPGFCCLVHGDWGSVRTSGSVRDDVVELRAVFTGCTGVPGDLISYPSSLEGHSFSGRLSGSLGPDTVSLQGVLDSLDREPAEIPFRLGGRLGEAFDLEATTDLAPVEPVLQRWLVGFDPAAYVRLDPEGSATLCFGEGRPCSYSVEASFDSARIYSSLLAPDTVEFSARAAVRGEIGSDRFTVDSGVVSLGDVGFEVTVEAAGGRVMLHAWNPGIGGEAITSSIPDALQGRLLGTRLSGCLGVDLVLLVDSDCAESSDVVLEVDASRLSVDWCPVGVSWLGNGGSCEMSDSWGNSRTIRLDPSENEAFVPLDSMPAAFEDLLCCAEDGEFRRHSGFSPGHIRSSLIADVSSRRFVRGASTLTMQLARNLFLSRERTLSRKLQEIFLTWRLEQCLSKDRILEIYANIVELGPDVFGFPEAAGYYFGCRMQDLSTRQIAYLVSLLPGPRPYHRFFERGDVPAWWEDYLDVLIRGAANRGGISPSEEERALVERITFPGRPGPQACRYSRNTFCSVILSW